jgi:hypothetical protein
MEMHLVSKKSKREECLAFERVPSAFQKDTDYALLGG